MPEIYMDGCGQPVLVHTSERCEGQNCVIHNPSNHRLRDCPTYWDNDLKLMYRVMGRILIIDPDELAYQLRRLQDNSIRILQEVAIRII